MTENLFQSTDAALMHAAGRGHSAELAFYGGTFTALPESLLVACLEFYRRRAPGLIACGRCSTRPDAVSPPVLARLKNAGLDLVELGVQSFSSQALQWSARGYDGPTALMGCHAVMDAGLSLGIQLLPGMPGVAPDIFLADVDRALTLRPACLRFYPCVVPEGTRLADMWRNGEYQPWSLDDTVETLAEGLRRAWAAHVPVVRLAVAPEGSFDSALVAGPRHPALGALIQARALLKVAGELTQNARVPLEGIALPRACQGYMYGERGTLRGEWEALGLPPRRVHFHGEPAHEGWVW